MKKNILVVGSVALDSVKTIHGSTKRALGGSAVHFSLSASQFSPVKLVGVVGKDFPASFRRLLTRRNIDLKGMQVLPGRTFHWEGLYDRDFKNASTIATHLNVFEHFKPKLSHEHSKCGVLFLANIDPDLQLDVLGQMAKPRLVACDTMNYWISSKPDALRELLAKVNIFFGNEEEAKKLTKQPNALRAANVISEWGPSVVVIKKGEHGAVLKAGNKFYVFPAFPLEAVKDPTGAGDTFAGGFMGYLAATGAYDDVDALKRAMLYGTVMASYNVEDFSTRVLEGLTRAKIEERFHDFLDRLAVSREPVTA